VAGGAVVEAAYLRGPRRDGHLAEQAADIGGDPGRIGPARCPLEQPRRPGRPGRELQSAWLYVDYRPNESGH
jgi:hypothetical protein